MVHGSNLQRPFSTKGFHMTAALSTFPKIIVKNVKDRESAVYCVLSWVNSTQLRSHSFQVSRRTSSTTEADRGRNTVDLGFTLMAVVSFVHQRDGEPAGTTLRRERASVSRISPSVPTSRIIDARRLLLIVSFSRCREGVVAQRLQIFIPFPGLFSLKSTTVKCCC